MITRFIINQVSKFIRSGILKMAKNAEADQKKVFLQLINKAQNTQFGKDHHFSNIKTHKEYVSQVPVRNYEDLKPYIDAILAEKPDILWPGKPKYFAKTSGTTSGVKYIPISKESMPYHISSARNATMNYVAQTKDDIFTKNMIFLSGSPELDLKANVKTGRLSGIVNHEIPGWVKRNQIPSFETNCIEEWEAKLDKIIEESLDADLSLISGIPPWVLMYYEKLLAKTGKANIKEIFPNFKLFIHGGVNYAPYKNSIEKLTGPGVVTLETYPASEGFFAFQDDPKKHDLLLNTNAGIFYEFIEASKFFDENPERLTISEVEIGVDYALIISTNAGLWAYNIGDLVRFTSKDPYRIVVSGRLKHFISAFGEHVIGKEVEEAIQIVGEKYNLKIVEFTVAPQVNPPAGKLPYHEWLIEFEEVPDQLDIIAHHIDQEMTRQNIYYRDLIDGGILQTLQITPLPKDSFRNYMKSKGKLGGQNKVPRLTNDRTIADQLN